MKKKWKWIAIVIVCTLAVIFIMKKGINGNLLSLNRSALTESVTKVIENSKLEKFYSYGKYIYKAGKDGIELLDSNGELLWKEEFSINVPQIIHDNGRYIAVLERNGNFINLYNENGRVYQLSFENPILSCTINNNAYTSVICLVDGNYKVFIYNDEGKIIFTGNFVSEDSGYPINTDISSENDILAVTFLQTKGLDLSTNIVFYYIGAEEEGNSEIGSDRVFGGILQEDALAGIVKFLGKNRVIIVSDKSIDFVEINHNEGIFYSEKKSIPLKNTVKYVDFTEDNHIVVVFGEPLMNSNDFEDKNTVQIFNIYGNKVNEFKAGKDVTGIYTGYGATIIEMNRYFVCLQNKGGILWTINKLQDIKDVLLVNNKKRVMFVYDRQMEIYNINRKINVEEETSQEMKEENSEKTSEKTSENTDEITSFVFDLESITENVEELKDKITFKEKLDYLTNKILNFLRGNKNNSNEITESESNGFEIDETKNTLE